jgi:polyhydroxyalkanoate synthesis regulator phasin
MALESIRGYVQLASGMGELTRARAMEAARGLLSLPGGQVTAVADELLAVAAANRENLSALVRAEVEAAVGRLGLTPAKEVAQLRAEVDRLRRENAALVTQRAAQSGGQSGAMSGGQEEPRRATAPRTRKKAASTTTKPATSSRAAKSAAKSAAKRAAKKDGA